MFTGLIETIGQLSATRRRNNYRLLRIKSDLPMGEIAIGDSIACDGVCLTVTEKRSDQFTLEASPETTKRTTLGAYKVGRLINLERALRVGDRLGGHFVNGHVDSVGKITRLVSEGEALIITLGFDQANSKWCVPKGSIAVNGISLTVNDCGPGWLSVNIIPHTLAHTNLIDMKAGARVNLEFDILGKYVTNSIIQKNENRLTIAKLKESGW